MKIFRRSSADWMSLDVVSSLAAREPPNPGPQTLGTVLAPPGRQVTPTADTKRRSSIKVGNLLVQA